MPIFVESLIRTSLEELWQATQDPAQHQRWDLRFSEIRYLPKESESAPQRFHYRTLAIHGEGESVGEREGDGGMRASALRFWSHDAKSLIREGSGFWKYEPRGATIRFHTVYDYRTRFGMLGRIIDFTFFRPLMAWATAWSFDRLRLWLEDGVPPDVALRLALVQGIARATLALLWIYQGIVPKLLVTDSGELALAAATVGATLARPSVVIAAVLEILIGVLLLVMRRSRLLVWLSTAFVSLLTIAGIVATPRIAVAPFNAVTLTAALVALGAIVLQAMRGAPSAARARWSATRVLP